MVYNRKPGLKPHKVRHNSGTLVMHNRLHAAVMEQVTHILRHQHQFLKVQHMELILKLIQRRHFPSLLLLQRSPSKLCLPQFRQTTLVITGESIADFSFAVWFVRSVGRLYDIRLITRVFKLQSS